VCLHEMCFKEMMKVLSMTVVIFVRLQDFCCSSVLVVVTLTSVFKWERIQTEGQDVMNSASPSSHSVPTLP
jgi:hypothetical protein